MDADSPFMDVCILREDGRDVAADRVQHVLAHTLPRDEAVYWMLTVRLFDADRPFMDVGSPYMDVCILREDGRDVVAGRVQHVLAHALLSQKAPFIGC